MENPTTSPVRERLPNTRQSITHKVRISDPAMGDMSLYITVGMYEDGRPGELFAHIGKQGTTLRGLLDTVAVEMSLLLQYAIPIDEIARQFAGTRFEPMGNTSNPLIPSCSSIIDYVVKWLEYEFPNGVRRGTRSIPILGEPIAGSEREAEPLEE